MNQRRDRRPRIKKAGSVRKTRSIRGSITRKKDNARRRIERRKWFENIVWSNMVNSLLMTKGTFVVNMETRDVLTIEKEVV